MKLKKNKLFNPIYCIKILLLIFFIVASFNINPVHADNTLNHPEVRNTNWANIWLDNIVGRGHIGVNVVMDGYNPCQNNSDPYYGACIMSKDGPASYYKVYSYNNGSTDFPYGMFIDNTNQNYCTLNTGWCNQGASSFNHKWANRVTYADVEIYPHDNTGVYNPYTIPYGGARIIIDTWSHNANSGLYSYPIGTVNLPQDGGNNTSKLNGFIYNNGTIINSSRLSVEMFQDIPGYENGRKMGALITGFSAAPNKSDGYYNSGPMYPGQYKVYLTDSNTGKKIIVRTDIYRPYERVDIHLDRDCFGFSICQKLVW